MRRIPGPPGRMVFAGGAEALMCYNVGDSPDVTLILRIVVGFLFVQPGTRELFGFASAAGARVLLGQPTWNRRKEATEMEPHTKESRTC